MVAAGLAVAESGRWQATDVVVGSLLLATVLGSSPFGGAVGHAATGGLPAVFE